MRKKTLALFLTCVLAAGMLAGCGNKDSKDNNQVENSQGTESAKDDQAAADEVAELIDAIYVQERTDKTDEQCAAAKEAWDKLTDAQKALVEGEEASPEYFGADTGDASKDDPRNQDEIGENELLVVSFGTSFNDSRAQDIKGIEDKLQEAYPDWSVRRAFTAQIIINHVEARDDEVIDNMDQALDRAVANGVKNLVVQPTHLMHGAEYDELAAAVENYQDQFESVKIAEPLLGEVGTDADTVNDDKKAVAEAQKRIAELMSSDGNTRKRHAFRFVLDDQHVITHLSQFRNAEARTLAQKCFETGQQISEAIDHLDALREQYAKRKTVTLSKQILESEKALEEACGKLSSMEKRVRQLELGK